MTRIITDMAGREVEIPNKISRIYAPSPYGSAILASIAPDLMVGTMLPIEAEAKKFLPSSLHNLPVIGKYSETQAIMDARVDLILLWAEKAAPFHKKSEQALTPLGIPFIYAVLKDLVDLRDYAPIYRFLGKIIGRESEGELRALYCESVIEKAEKIVNKVHPRERPRVYYAEGADGLSTEFSDSLHAHVLQLAGDVNVFRGRLEGHAGMEPVMFEELERIDPDVILMHSPRLAAAINESGSPWKRLSAVKNNRAKLIPHLPFNWFDRPPSFMRLLGLQWVMSLLYPEHYEDDLIDETLSFFKIFLNISIEPADAKRLLSGRF